MLHRNLAAPAPAQPVLDRLDEFESRIVERLQSLAGTSSRSAVLRSPRALVPWVIATVIVSSLATMAIVVWMR